MNINFLTIEKQHNGAITIEDDISGEKITYYFCSEKSAIQEHRRRYNLKYKHFTKIYIKGW